MTHHSNKFALVTGAGSGIGRAVACALFDAGFDLVLAGRRQSMLDETAELCRSRPGRVLARACDVSKPEAVTALFDEIQSIFGRLDILFNNAGLSARAVPIDELTFDEWAAVVDVNLMGAFLCAQGAFRLMKTQRPMGGRIINNGSISASVPRPFSAPYTATKHAVTGLTKSLSLDGRAFDIACSQIDIGNAETAMTDPMAAGVRQADGSIRPEARFDVSHVADAVVYMAGLPLSANVQFMTLMATKMPFIGRG
ncbi:3-oxoacyl-ACP reductase [Hyphomicrobium nitrativorans NL23]|uniref:3-oxoacyl-ACP reductase n=1 Tax=Hyphomicrobium nitrativorans NL23 TaxID=1029756 RepID=V5SAR8_9HYPH|nr:SDR family oxidoreductase [Hyphomicrobium nitrativorans]AHB47527.1 3-oxoacyl-ACP reductase [Hyphomicrobium nitrativorans NL23]